MSFSAQMPGLSRAKIIVTAIAVILIALAAWTYSEKTYKQRITGTNADLVAIVQNMRKLFLHSPTVDVSGTADMKLNAIDSGSHIYIESDVFPKSMIAPDRKTALNRWDGGAAITEATLSTKGDGFYVYLDGLSKRACTDLLVSNTAPGSDAGLRAVGAGPAGTPPTVETTDLPLSLPAAQGLCTASRNAIGFAYALHPGGLPPEAAPAPAPKPHAKPAVEKPQAEKPAAEKPVPAKPAPAKPADKKAPAKPAKAR